MGEYQYDMSAEKQPKIKKLLPEGERAFIVRSCEPSVSKAGNDMFVIELEDKETGYMDTIYPIATQGKRWFLKQLLTACGVEAGKDGVYDWSPSDILNKEVYGIVEHEDNEYINRSGDTVTAKQHRIVSINIKGWDE